ncbi:MAG: NUDIX hydrolase [Geminicoccaceae bacterium]
MREDTVLLLRRAKEPMKGLWVAPGGKIEPGESPWQCANRELQEETGLQANGLMLRGIITETSPRPDWQWLIFIYVAKETSGQMIRRSEEGELAWVPVSRMTDMPPPEADRIFGPKVLDLEASLYHAHFIFDEAKVLQSVLECPSQVLG